MKDIYKLCLDKMLPKGFVTAGKYAIHEIVPMNYENHFFTAFFKVSQSLLIFINKYIALVKFYVEDCIVSTMYPSVSICEKVIII